jgi:EF-P beta-lysylation protein EpmB
MQPVKPLAAIALHSAGDWQQQLRECISDGAELARTLGLQPEALGLSAAAARQFPLKVPRAFAARMRRGDPNDPLLLQVLATVREEQTAPGFGADPVGEVAGALEAPGIVHKYRGRALLLLSAGCAINCRYCFRRHFPYGEHQPGGRQRQAALDYLAAHRDIGEVILSGGDPLVARDSYLRDWVRAIAALPHVHTLRIHTRLPVVLPDRITAGLIEAICPERLRTVLVVHSNHAQEIDHSVRAACAQLRTAGVTLLNQSVLLAGINDSTSALAALSDALFEAGVLPYYLHVLDRVAGAAHFEVEEQHARELVGELAAQRPGYLVPRLVREVPGTASKRELAPLYPC